MAHSRLKRLRQALGEESTFQDAVQALSREGEGEVLQQIVSFTDEVVTIVEKLEDVVERFAADRYEELSESARELDELESGADDTKEFILDRLSLGGIFPMHRADLASLVTSIDSIANLAAGAADRIGMRRFSLPERMNQLLVDLAQVDSEAARGLREAVAAMARDLRQAIKLADAVDKIESRADDVFAELYQLMFDMEMDFKTFHQLKAILERLESIADRCAENAELLRHMALEYIERG